jgi:hypothetical protein
MRAVPSCPVCLAANPPGAAVCVNCGKFRFPSVGVDSGRVMFAAADGSSAAPMAMIDTPPPINDIEPPPSAPRTVAFHDLPAFGPAAPAPAITRLSVIRGTKIGFEFPIYEGRNYIGRTADTPADIDLTAHEDSEQVWTSRKHALLTLDNGTMILEDLNSLNGTFVNRTRLHPGQQRVIRPGDVIAVGTVHLRVLG